MDSARASGQVITFYSYKGGTGRSMALANVGYLLAEQLPPGSRGILLIDWYLEAPGLHRYFDDHLVRRSDLKKVRQSAEKRDASPGLIDFLEFAVASYPRNSGEPSQPDHSGAESVLAGMHPNFFECFSQFVGPTGVKNLSILRAGRFDAEYPERIRKFDWEGFHRRDPGFFRAFRHHLSQSYDYVLIDSRTGLTDTSGICVQQMPEKLVLVFVPNRQNLEGIVEVARRSGRFRASSPDPRPLVIFPLASRIDGTNEYLRAVWRNGGKVGETEIAGYQKTFEDLFVELYGLEECDLEAYFDATQLKHDSDYAYGERIAARRGTTERLSLGYTFADFTRRLVSLSAPWEPLPAEVEVQESKRRETQATQSEKGARSRARIWAGVSVALGLILAFLTLFIPSILKSQSVLTAVRAASDPLDQALLLTELDDFPPPWGGTTLARQVAATPLPFAVLRGHKGPIFDVAFSPDGSEIATASEDGTARLWSAEGNHSSLVLKGHKGAVVSVSWLPGAGRRTLVTASRDGGALVWRDGQAVQGAYNQTGEPLLGAFFGEGDIIAVERDGFLEAYQGELQLRREPRQRIFGFGFDPQRRFIVVSTGSAMGAQIYDTKTMKLLLAIQDAPIVTDAMALSPDASFLMTSSALGVTLWQIESSFMSLLPPGLERRLIRVVSVPETGEGTAQAIAFKPQGLTCAIGTSVGTASVFSYDPIVRQVVPDRELLRVLGGHSAAVRALAFSPDGKQLATASDDATVRVWNLADHSPGEDLGWAGLLRYLRQQTVACLPVEKRVDLLGETMSKAQENYSSCEKRYRREVP